jgi:hypothetical protein
MLALGQTITNIIPSFKPLKNAGILKQCKEGVGTHYKQSNKLN